MEGKARRGSLPLSPIQSNVYAKVGQRWAVGARLPTMSEPLVIYHNPRCSKSRQALALLQERVSDLVVVEYLKTPPKESELRRFVELVGPSEIVRQGEAAYAEAGIDASSSAEQIAAAIVAHPALLQRPLVVRGERAVIGRPPERVLELVE